MLNLVTINDSKAAVLFQKAQPVTEFDGALHALLEGMRETMAAYAGLGLAAPQVGHSLSAIVLSDQRWPELINPVVLAASTRTLSRQESCLSIPDVRVEVKRPVEIKLKAQDRTGAPIHIAAKGELARLLQHELDHLQGRLIGR